MKYGRIQKPKDKNKTKNDPSQLKDDLINDIKPTSAADQQMMKAAELELKKFKDDYIKEQGCDNEEKSSSSPVP